MGEARVLDVEGFSNRSTQARFPSVFLKEVNATTPLVISVLEQGDMPVIGEHNGVKKVICSISTSAYNINKLLRTHSEVELMLSATDVKSIKDVKDYLEEFKWT